MTRATRVMTVVAALPAVVLVAMSPRWALSGRVAADEPYLQVVGHYAEGQRGRSLTVGNGAEADLLLSESGIDAMHGRLVPAGRHWRYVHASASQTADGDGLIDDAAIRTGDKVFIRDGTAPAPACNVSAPSADVKLTNAARLLVARDDEPAGVLLLADVDDALVALGGSQPPLYLGRCEGRFGLSASSRCTSSFVSVEGFWRNLRATLGRPAAIDGVLKTLVTKGDPRLQQLAGIHLGVPLFRSRPATFWSIGTGASMPTNGVNAERITQSAADFRVVAESGSSVLISGEWFRLGERPAVRIRRANDDVTKSLWVCRNGTTPLLIGELANLEQGSRWILGGSQYRLAVDRHRVELLPEERSDRTHYFLSLSAGRINAFQRRQSIPTCGQGRLRLVGQQRDRASALNRIQTVSRREMAPTDRLMTIPLPWWVAAVHPSIVNDRGDEADYGYACVSGGTLFLTPPSARPVGAGVPVSAIRPVDGSGRGVRYVEPEQRFRVAGHTYEFRTGSPRFEQIVPLLVFVIFLGLAGARALWLVNHGLDGALDQAGGGGGFGPRAFLRMVAVIIAAMSALMTCGALLLLEMAADDRLIGKPDYLHRQLIMAAVAITTFVAIMAAAAAGGRENDTRRGALARQLVRRLRAAAENLLLGGLAIVAWILLDALAWLLIAGPWARASGVRRVELLGLWGRSFAYGQIGGFLFLALVLYVVCRMAARSDVTWAARFGLDRAWRFALGRDVIVALTTSALLLLPLLHGSISSPLSVWTVVAWIALGVLAVPLVDRALSGAASSWPTRALWSWGVAVVACIALAFRHTPAGGVELAEALLFLGLTTVAAAASGSAILLMLRGTRQVRHLMGAVLAIYAVITTLVGAWALSGGFLLLALLALVPQEWRERAVNFAGLGTGAPAAHEPKYVSPHFQLLAAGFFVLSLGLIVQSGRSGVGMKPAEFAMWFLAPGLAMFLAARWDLVLVMSPTKPSRAEFVIRSMPLALLILLTFLIAVAGEFLLAASVLAVGLPAALYLLPHSGWRNQQVGLLLQRASIPITTMFLMLALQLTVMLLYAAQGDFGPLLVLVPSVLLTVAYWVVTPERAGIDAQSLGRRILERVAIVVALLCGTIGLGAAGYAITTNETVQNLPFLGASIRRAADRLLTFLASWYTTSGSWTIDAKWIAAGYANERYISNLHSDLAIVAMRQSFGSERTYAVVLLYFVIAAALAFIAANFHHSYSTLLEGRDDEDADATRRQALVASLTLWFATFYLLTEVLVHVLTNFNFIPQTGLVLPWVSSGGSAAIAFSGLIAIALAMATHVYVRLMRERR